MQIRLMPVTVRKLVEDYSDKGQSGVIGYGGRLDIRPPFQREFVYKPEQRDAVIRTILKGYPLNVMYWAERVDGNFEIVDGQQRTISIAQYVHGDYSLDNNYFHSISDENRDDILDYELSVYVCQGTDKEKLDWFEIINIAGEVLTKQELRNAVYTGPWLADAKQIFSKSGCPAYGLGSKYVIGSPIRQEYLETVIGWACGKTSDDAIREYMSKHQYDNDAKPLWVLFQNVIDWIGKTFTEYRKELKRKDWGFLYKAHKNNKHNSQSLETEIEKLMEDDEVTNKRGIYPYVLNREEKHLSIRAFSTGMKRQVFEKQNRKCSKCDEEFKLSEMEADHITPWSQGGKTVEENCQVLCKTCNRAKGAR